MHANGYQGTGFQPFHLVGSPFVPFVQPYLLYFTFITSTVLPPFLAETYCSVTDLQPLHLDLLNSIRNTSLHYLSHYYLPI